MKDNDFVVGQLIMITLIVAILSGVVGVILSSWLTDTSWKELAVKHNAASWQADKNGAVYFKWNDE